jgi:uncharacterized protein YbgA (DUF1722 family)
MQDMLLLACTHPENRNILTTMPEWPEWLLEILIANYEMNCRLALVESKKKKKKMEVLKRLKTWSIAFSQSCWSILCV